MQEWQSSRTFKESFQYAWEGIRTVFGEEANIRRQFVISLVVLAVAVGLWLRSEIVLYEIGVLVAVSGMVLALELVNTAIEQIENVLHPEYHQAIKRSKDIAAGAVLMASITAVVVGVLILGPPLLRVLVY